MGTIRKHEVRILVAASFVLVVVLAAAVIYGSPEATSSSVPRTKDAVALDGVDIVITGPAERTSAGYEVPVKVTNHREEAISIKDMRIFVTLTDLSVLNATCHGPDSVAPGTTENFLVLIDSPVEIEIFVIDLVQGTHYLRAVMPVVSPGLVLPDVPQVETPDEEEPPTGPVDETPGPGPADPEPQEPARVEPAVSLSLDGSLPLRPDYFEGNPPLYGQAASGRVIVQVIQPGDPTDVAVYIHFPDLAPDQVSVTASYAGGAAIPVLLAMDASGCFGLLADEASGSNCTWHYDGSGNEYYNISVAVTTYVLGTHELRLYAYDAGTGGRISNIEDAGYTVYGSAGASGMFDTAMATDLEDPFTPGAVYNLTFTDSCRYDQYRGSVRSVFKCPYAASVWLVADGAETLLEPNGLGEYTFTWAYDGTAHEAHLRVQMAFDGVHPLATGQYWLEDASTGMVLSPAIDGAQGTTFAVRGPEIAPP